MRALSSDGIPGLASDAIRGDLWDDELITYTDDEDGYDWDFYDVPVDSHVDRRASPRRNFDTIHELCLSANVYVPEYASRVIILALQNLNDITERDPAVPAKAVRLQRVGVVEGISASSLAGCTLEKIDVVCERN